MNISYEPSLKKKKKEESCKEKSDFMVHYKELIKKRKEKDDYYKDNESNTNTDQDKNPINQEIIDKEKDHVKLNEIDKDDDILIKETIQGENSDKSRLIDINDKELTLEEPCNSSDELYTNNKMFQSDQPENKQIDLFQDTNQSNTIDYEFNDQINHKQNHKFIVKKEVLLNDLNFADENKKIDSQELKYLRFKYLKRNKSVLKLLNKDIFFRILSNESLFSEFEDTMNNFENTDTDHHDSMDFNLNLDKGEKFIKDFEEKPILDKIIPNAILNIDIPIKKEQMDHEQELIVDVNESNLQNIIDKSDSIDNIEKDIINTKKCVDVPLQCQNCTFNTTENKILIRHEKNDHNEIDDDNDEEDYLFRCDRGCNFTSDRYDKYNKHLIYHIHKDCEPYYLECIYTQCSLCPFASSIIQIVKKHMNNFHSLCQDDYTIKKELLINDDDLIKNPEKNSNVYKNKINGKKNNDETEIENCDKAISEQEYETLKIDLSDCEKTKEKQNAEEVANDNKLEHSIKKKAISKNLRMSYRKITNNNQESDIEENIKQNDFNFYICSYCEDVRELFDDMKKHIYIMHCRPPKEKTLCWVCMKYFESDKHLIEHLSQHDDPFQEILIYDNIKGKNKNDICLSLFNREGVAIKTAKHLSKYLNFPLFIDSSTLLLNGGNLYGCNYCNYTCSVTSNIRAHADKYHQGCEISIRKHNEKRKYCVNRCNAYLTKNNTCIFCKFGSFANKGERYYHMKNKHGIDICKLCNDCLTVMKNSYLKCDLCDNFDGTISDLRKHRKSHFIRQHYRKLNIVKCVINYMKNFTEISEDIFVCRHCKFISDKKDHSFLRKHLRDTHKFNLVCKKCSACKRHANKQLKSSISKNTNQDIRKKTNHLNSIETNNSSVKKRLFRCNRCDFGHSDIKGLQEHILKHKNTFNAIIKTEKKENETINIKRLYKCSFDNCDYEAHKKFCIEIHIMGHLNYKPYICPVCRACYTAIHLLKEHMKNHLNNTRSMLCNYNKKTENVIQNFYTKNESIIHQKKVYFSDVTIKNNKIPLNNVSYNQTNHKDIGRGNTNSTLDFRIKKEKPDDFSFQSTSTNGFADNMKVIDDFNGIRIKKEKIDISYERESKLDLKNDLYHDHSYFDFGHNIEQSTHVNLHNNLKHRHQQKSSCDIDDIINVVQQSNSSHVDSQINNSFTQNQLKNSINDKSKKVLLFANKSINTKNHQKLVIEIEDIMHLNTVKLQELLNLNNVTSANLL